MGEDQEPVDGGGVPPDPQPVPARQRHPRALTYLFLTEMWERFSFYLMLGLLYQYLTDNQKGGMGWSGEEASSVYGSYLALVYFTPFLGGVLADRLLGTRRAIVIGCVFMMLGHVALAVPATWALYVGLLCLVVGSGFFKANMSTLVGNLYPPGSPLKDAAYNIFFMGINIGAFLCNFVAAIVRNIWGWHAAFATAGLGMAIGLGIFLSANKLLASADVDPRQGDSSRASLSDLWVRCLGPAVLLGAAGFGLVEATGWDPLALGGPTTGFLLASVPVVLFYVGVWRKTEDRADRSRVAALLTVFTVVIIFWAIVHQAGTALMDWAVENTDRRPVGPVAALVGAVPEIAENASPTYFDNADAETPRPDRETFQVVSDARYAELKRKKLLSVRDAEPVLVSQAVLDSVYAGADDGTPILPTGKHLKLVNAELLQSINPALVIFVTPLLIAFWAFLARRRREPSTPAKIGLGLLLTAGGPAVMFVAVLVTHDGATKASVWWLVGTFAIVTFGELCLGPMGLSLVSKMSPAKIRAFMMGGWFLSAAIGSKLSGVFGELYHSWPHVRFFVVLIVSVLAAAAVIWLLLPWLRRQMPDEAPS